MLRVIPPEEARRQDDVSFAGIRVGTLFNYYIPPRKEGEDEGKRQLYCIAKEEVEPGLWKVIPLTVANKHRIIAGERPVEWMVSRGTIACINVIGEVAGV
ncbi:MAG TPA: hypothetical protein VD862_01500 [Candidatus Paceibacterota bacterium]|nr:hypothetical protein [Candidatus Paceibacterota bacterium]